MKFDIAELNRAVQEGEKRSIAEWAIDTRTWGHLQKQMAKEMRTKTHSFRKSKAKEFLYKMGENGDWVYILVSLSDAALDKVIKSFTYKGN